MDDFGIGAAALGAFRSVLSAMRGTGRTTRLIERYRDGDRIIFSSEKEAQRVARLAKERGVTIDWSVCDPKRAGSVFDLPRGTPKGRMHFDHGWLEEYFESRIEAATQDIRHMQDQASGYGEPHQQTREAARMISQFRL